MRRTRVLWIAIAAAIVAFAIAAIAFVSVVPIRSDTMKARIVQTLGDRLNGDVTLDDLSLRVLPRLHAVGTGLVIHPHGRTPDAPPLIAIKTFTVDTGLLDAWRKRVSHVTVTGLTISILPKNDDDDESASSAATPSSTPANDALSAAKDVVIETLDTTDAKLVIIPRETDKNPKVWAIHRLRMHDLSTAHSMPYEATLTNGVPPGEIVTSGHFGPWNRDDAGATPLDGVFTFDHADLGVFKGIGGTLSARGTFDGSLGVITVHGETDTPNFVIAVGGQPFPLHAKYFTIVDGTNGDTRLERIDATLLQSTLVAKGAVLDGPKDKPGRTVSLNIDMQPALIQDVMHMILKTPQTPMTGALKLTTTFLLPPGDRDVVERLKLNGRFELLRAKFTNPDVQSKIVELSRRSRGEKHAKTRENVASDFRGRFTLGNATLQLASLVFGVPGARVTLAGRYGLQSENLAFKGSLLMDAKVSQTMTGFKSFLLRAVDPLFTRKGGGSEIPIKIEGTRRDPKIGLDVRRVFRRNPGP